MRSICVDGRLPSMINRKMPPKLGTENRSAHNQMLHVGIKCRGKWCPHTNRLITWSKHNAPRTEAERKRRFRVFMETGRL